MSVNRLRFDATLERVETRPASQSSTLTRVFSLDPNEEPALRRPSMCTQAQLARSSVVQLQHPYHKEDPSLRYHALLSFSFLIKLAQLLITITCAALYTEGLKLITHSISTQMFPNVVFASYLIITSVILLSYMLGQKMPELLIRIFNTLASILFFIAFALTVTEWSIFGDSWAHPLDVEYNEADIDSTTDDDTDMFAANRRRQVDMLLAEGGLSLINSILYLADVIFSIRRTLSYL